MKTRSDIENSKTNFASKCSILSLDATCSPNAIIPLIIDLFGQGISNMGQSADTIKHAPFLSIFRLLSKASPTLKSV